MGEFDEDVSSPTRYILSNTHLKSGTKQVPLLDESSDISTCNRLKV